MKQNREYRAFDYQINDGSYIVEGYASTFDPYVLMTIDGIDYSERIEPTAFDEADMSDVVFRVDHEGKVYARTSNGAIKLDVDGHGLHHQTDLGLTERAKELFEDIKVGNYPKMSFAFTVAEGGDHYDRENHMRIIDRVAKVFDISPVSFPANPNTELSVRDYFNGVIEMEKAERLEAEKRQREKEKLELKLKMMEVKK